MAVSSELTELIKEQLEGFGPVAVRKMFGGVGLFRQGLMFALLADDVFYLKSDAVTMPDFEAENLPSFGYESKTGRRTIMSYTRAPEWVFDDTDEMLAWAQKAFEAAIRADNAKPASKRKYHG
jgi:DNA transformation protein